MRLAVVVLLLLLAAQVGADDAYSETLEVEDTPKAVLFRKCKAKGPKLDPEAVPDVFVCSSYDTKSRFGAVRVRITNAGPELGFVYVVGAPLAVTPGQTVVISTSATAIGLQGVAVAADKGKATKMHVFASNPVVFEP